MVTKLGAGSAIGNLAYWDGTQWVVLTPASARKFLKQAAAEAPAWDTLVADDIPSHVHPTKGASAINRLAGVVPVASGWGTDPTDLANSTDNDWTTSTGIGSKAVSGYGVAGALVWDMGAIYIVSLGGIVMIGDNYVAGQRERLEIQYSTDDSTYVSAMVFDEWGVAPWMANEQFTRFLPVTRGRARYIRLRWRAGDNACTIYGSVTEIQALDLGL